MAYPEQNVAPKSCIQTDCGPTAGFSKKRLLRPVMRLSELVRLIGERDVGRGEEVGATETRLR
jgi:hypothetical protein